MVLVRDIGPDAVVVSELAESQELRQSKLDPNERVLWNAALQLATCLEELYFLRGLDVYRKIGEVAAVCFRNVYQIVSYPRSFQCI